MTEPSNAEQATWSDATRDYVCDLQIENERLRSLVEDAYADGFTDAWGIYDNKLSRIAELSWHWEHSDTRAALQPKEPT